MGEAAFFSEKRRKASARSKNFTEVLTLNKADFLEGAETYPTTLESYYYIQREIIEN